MATSTSASNRVVQSTNRSSRRGSLYGVKVQFRLDSRVYGVLRRAVPNLSVYMRNLVYDATSEAYGWVDMNYMSVSLRVNRTSNLMILFSTDAYCTTGPSESTYIYIQALVNSSYVNPNYVTLNPNVQVTGFSFLPAHAHYMSAGAYSFIFNMPSVAPGFYTIKIQWQVSYGSPQGTGYVGYRTLTAIALPT
jgi:hypothetical protein